jgi:lipocalin
VRVDVNQLVHEGNQTSCSYADFALETVGPSGKPTAAPWLRYKAGTLPLGLGSPPYAIWGNVTQVAAPNGQLNVLFDAGTRGPGSLPNSQPLTVAQVTLNADQSQYDFAILYGGGAAYESVFALTRVPTMSATYAAAFDNFLSSTGFTVPIYKVPQPASCIYGGPGQSPVLVNNLDLSKYTGLWYQHVISVNQLVFQGGTTVCDSVTYTSSATGLLDTSTSQSSLAAVGPQAPITVIQANIVASSTPGLFTVNFAPGTMYPGSPAFSSPLSVVDAVLSVDGSTYDFTIHSNGASFSTIFALSRTPQLAPVYQDRFAAFVANTHFWGNLYNVSQPANCYYGPNTPSGNTGTGGHSSWSTRGLILGCCLGFGVVAAGVGVALFRRSKTKKNYSALEDQQL